MHPLLKRTLTVSIGAPTVCMLLRDPLSCRAMIYFVMFLTLLEYDKLSPIHRVSMSSSPGSQHRPPSALQSIAFAGVGVFIAVLLDKDLHLHLKFVDDFMSSCVSSSPYLAALQSSEDVVLFRPTLILFLTVRCLSLLKNVAAAAGSKRVSAILLSFLLDLFLTAQISVGFYYLILLATTPAPLPEISESPMTHALYFSFIVWNVDTGALLTGKFFPSFLRLIGLDSRAPPSLYVRLESCLKILSPSKTLIGIAGGVAFGVMTSVSMSLLSATQGVGGFDFPHSFGVLRESSRGWCGGGGGGGEEGGQGLGDLARCAAVLGVVMSVFAIGGDLIESVVKRLANVKDSGNLLPGHGGIYDRMDSMLLCSIVYFWGFQYGWGGKDGHRV